MSRSNKVNSLIKSGVIQFDSATKTWSSTCPKCKKFVKSRWKNNVVKCSRCHPVQPKASKRYWNEDTESALVEYIRSEDQNLRNKIFEEKLKYPFEKLVECIFNTFKFSYFETGPLEIQKECIGHLVMNIHKFDPSRNTKSFSYFSIIAKNFLIALNNNNYDRFNRFESVDLYSEVHVDGDSLLHKTTLKQLSAEDKHFKERDTTEFFDYLVEFYDKNMEEMFPRTGRDREIAQAVMEIFRQRDRLEDFGKKSLYVYIREISGYDSQQITKVINKMKRIYQEYIKSNWLNEINGEQLTEMTPNI